MNDKPSQITEEAIDRLRASVKQKAESLIASIEQADDKEATYREHTPQRKGNTE